MSTRGGVSSAVEEYTARVDRLPTWGLSYALIWALGFSFFITLYDVVDVGFALPYIPYLTSASEGALVASLGLFGYVVGSPIISYIADRVGRRPTLIVSSLLTGIGSFGDAAAFNYFSLSLFRFITGMGIGADVVLVMTYITEQSPGTRRGSFANLAYLGGSLGSGIGPFIAAFLVTSFASGWRYAFFLGGLLAIVALLIRAFAPETVRYLANKGKFQEAEKQMSSMESTSMRRARIETLPPVTAIGSGNVETGKEALSILATPKYLKRLIALFLLMFFVYFGGYTYALVPEWLGTLGYTGATLSSLILVNGLTFVGVFVGALMLRPLIDRVDRRKTAISATLGYALGVTMMAFGAVTKDIPLFVFGSFITSLVGIGFTQVYYMLNTDNFPTRARATAYSLAEGLGHLGGAIGLAVFFFMVTIFGNILVWPVTWIGGIIAVFAIFFLTPETTSKRLETINEATD
jgi:MFS transporter, putative metabolite:H+ symporter